MDKKGNKEIKQPVNKVQEFIVKYNELVREYGLTVVPRLKLEIARVKQEVKQEIIKDDSNNSGNN